MKDDPDFNIHFVGVIEEHPCIYDHSISDYSNRNVIDNAWEKIAKRVSESGKYLHSVCICFINTHKVVFQCNMIIIYYLKHIKQNLN